MLPADLETIILDYAFGLEHAQKMRFVHFELINMYWVMKRVRMNVEFSSMFYPGFYQDVISEN